MTAAHGHEGEPVITDRMKQDGTWNPLWDGLEELDPKWTEQYLTATMQPYESGVVSYRPLVRSLKHSAGEEARAWPGRCSANNGP